MNEEDLLNVSSKLKESSFLCDAVWLDIEYSDNKKYFTWNKESFPDPEKMLKQLE